MSVLQRCPSYRESNNGSKERQGPTLGVRLIEVSVQRESTVHRFVSERKTQVAIEQTRFLNTVFLYSEFNASPGLLRATAGYCGLYCRAFARLVSPGGGAFANFELPGGRGPGICQPRTFDTHAVSGIRI